MAFHEDPLNYENLVVAKQGFDSLHFTENSNYQLNSKSILHNLGFPVVALVYYFESIGSDPGLTPNTFVGTPIPNMSEGFAEPWTPYAYNSFYVDKTTLFLYRQSAHTNDGLTYHIYYKYFLLAQAGYA